MVDLAMMLITTHVWGANGNLPAAAESRSRVCNVQGSLIEGRLVPAECKDKNELRPPTDVDAFPKDASPFGVMDLVGNVWQWTDEYLDEHSRGGILRGGSYFKPQGSNWYFPNKIELDTHGKLLLMAPSKDRAGTLGFRCVVDAAE